MTESCSRIMIAGTGGDSGKTIFSLGLLSAWRDDGLNLRAFKKGPDFIDAAWLGWAAGSPGRNLDTFMMGFEVVADTFRKHATTSGVNVIEGNRGLLDGLDASGTHSSAVLATALTCPVVLLITPAKVTATVAATVLGCRQIAPEVDLKGVVLNQVAGARHARVVRQAIEEHAGVPVLGELPKIAGQVLPSRHLGLVPPEEYEPSALLQEFLAKVIREHCDLEELLHVARSAPDLPARDLVTHGPTQSTADQDSALPGAGLRIGYFCDSAFTFYYPENLEALQEGGAELVAISALSDKRLPNIDALYIGGGFPETHTEQLSANSELHAAIRKAATDGLPIYAECGGLMYLSEDLAWAGNHVPMSGVLPIRVRMQNRPQGHGYCLMKVDTPNPFMPVGTVLNGHEFHYSHVTGCTAGLTTAFSVEKGNGCFGGRDGIVHGNTLASYLHLHALGCPAWAPGLLRAAASYREGKKNPRGGGGLRFGAVSQAGLIF